MSPTLRLLPLPFAIALALPAYGQQQFYDTELEPDYSLCPVGDAIPRFDEVPTGINMKPQERRAQPTEIEGDSQSGTIEMPVMEGNVSLRRGDQFIGTDKLVFDSANETYQAEGNVRFQDGSLRVLAERAEGNQAEDAHRIEGVRYQLLERQGNGGAERIEVNGETGKLFGATYSTCPPDDQHWKLVAREIAVDNEEGFAVARGAVFRLGKVPVAYVPWVKFPVDSRRRTGLLFPSISNSSRNGFDYKQPIYFNLAPNYDLTLSPRYMTRRGASLGAEFRFLNEAGGGTVRGMWMPNDDLRGRERGAANINAFQNLSRHWRATAYVSWISDPRYFEDFSNSSLGMAYNNLRSEVGVFGRGRYWRAGFSADYNQLADYTLTKRSLAYDRLPRAFVEWEQPVGTLLRAGVEAEAVRFRHQSWRALDALNDYQPYGPEYAIPGGSRLDIKPWVSMPLGGASWFVTPKVAWRYTRYQLEDALAQQLNPAAPLRTPRRSLPILSLDAGMYFERDFNWKQQGFLQTLEPRLFYLNVPYRDQSQLPLFDTRAMTFSWGQLFRDNRYSSADRQSDAHQITTALTSRILRDEDGFETFNASFGQIHYLRDARVTARSNERVIERGRSAWIADANWSPNANWLVGASYQWDPKYRRHDLISARGRYLFGDDGIINLSYRYRRDLLEQADFSFVYPLNPTWSVVGRYYYSLADKKALESIAGVQWDSCCVAARLIGRQYIRNREGETNNSIMLEIEFKGLGSAGQDTRRTLRRAILGYHRDDLYLVPPPSTTDGSPVTPPDSTDTTP